MHQNFYIQREPKILKKKYFFNNIEREIKETFGIELNRTGTIYYKSSSIFLHKNVGTLTEFLK